MMVTSPPKKQQQLWSPQLAVLHVVVLQQPGHFLQGLTQHCLQLGLYWALQ